MSLALLTKHSIKGETPEFLMTKMAAN